MGVDQQVGAAKGLSLPSRASTAEVPLAVFLKIARSKPGPGGGTFINGSFFLERCAAGGFDAAAYANPSDQT